MGATGVVMIQDNKNIIDRLESYLSNPLQPFDYSLLQEAYNEIMALRRAKDALYDTINLVGDLNIKLENQIKNVTTKGNDLVAAVSLQSDLSLDEAINNWFDLDLVLDWKNEYLESLRYRREYQAEAQHWREATYHLAHMLSRLDGGATADKFAVEAYEHTSTCYCEPEDQVYCHLHW